MASSRQLGRKNSFWSIDLQRDHLSEEALLRATRGMEVAVCQDAEANNSRWSSNDSADPGYLGARCGNLGQLWDKHRKFLAALPSYLEYGGGRSRSYHCPCSGGMAEWRKKIGLDILHLVKCKHNYAQLSSLMQHCNSKNNVYHRGFKEYMKAMTDPER